HDVVFGTTVSGRPAELEGAEEMVGLFINTLPVRMSPQADIPVMEWLKVLQRQQAEMRQFEYCSLVDVQGWSDVPRGQPLFESLFVFENFPVSNRHDKDKLHVTDSRSVGQTSLPLTLFSGVIGSKLGFRALYSKNIFEQASIVRLLRYM